MTAYTYYDCEISDLYKDVYWHRPDCEYLQMWNACTPAEKQQEWDRLVSKL